MKKVLIISIIASIGTTSFSQSFNQQRLDSLFQILDQKDKFMGSIAVSQNGKLLYSNSIGYSDLETSKKVTTQTKYRIGSISKMVTASLIFKAIDEHKLSLNTTLDHYFPKIEHSKKITIENLLNHRSGVHDFTGDEDYWNYYTQPKSETEMIQIITKGKSDFQPNSKAEYSNSNYVLLSFILEKIYKKDYPTILDEKIIKPLGLKNTYFGSEINTQNNECYSYHFDGNWNKETETNMSIPMGAGSLVSTPTDLTHFIEQLFAGKLISEVSLNVMTTLKDDYGMGIFEFPYLDKKGYGHDGAIDGFRSMLVYFPEEKLSIALISNGEFYKNQNILLCAESSYFNQPFEVPTFEKIDIDTETLSSYVGQYTSTQMPLKIEITIKESKLYAQATGQSAFPLEASSPTVFNFEQAGIVLAFNTSKNEMILKQGGREFLFTKE